MVLTVASVENTTDLQIDVDLLFKEARKLVAGLDPAPMLLIIGDIDERFALAATPQKTLRELAANPLCKYLALAADVSQPSVRAISHNHNLPPVTNPITKWSTANANRHRKLLSAVVVHVVASTITDGAIPGFWKGEGFEPQAAPAPDKEDNPPPPPATIDHESAQRVLEEKLALSASRNLALERVLEAARSRGQATPPVGEHATPPGRGSADSPVRCGPSRIEERVRLALSRAAETESLRSTLSSLPSSRPTPQPDRSGRRPMKQPQRSDR